MPFLGVDDSKLEQQFCKSVGAPMITVTKINDNADYRLAKREQAERDRFYNTGLVGVFSKCDKFLGGLLTWCILPVGSETCNRLESKSEFEKDQPGSYTHYRMKGRRQDIAIKAHEDHSPVAP